MGFRIIASDVGEGTDLSASLGVGSLREFCCRELLGSSKQSYWWLRVQRGNRCTRFSSSIPGQFGGPGSFATLVCVGIPPPASLCPDTSPSVHWYRDQDYWIYCWYPRVCAWSSEVRRLGLSSLLSPDRKAEDLDVIADTFTIGKVSIIPPLLSLRLLLA